MQAIAHREVEHTTSGVGFGWIGNRGVCVADIRGLIRRVQFERRVQLLYLGLRRHLSAAQQRSERVHAGIRVRV